MNASEFLDANDLNGAVAQLGSELRAAPSDHSKRTFLFELLCFAGDLDRAAKQLDAIGAESPDRDLAVQRYRNLLLAEKKRRRVFCDGVVPSLPEEVPPYTTLHLEAINRTRERRYSEARGLLEQSEEQQRAIHGKLNGTPFEDIRDADDLIGPYLEVMTGDQYFWIPWESVRLLAMEAPKHLRDLVWLPARLELDVGPSSEIFVPVLYVNSYQDPDDCVRLGRMTDWQGDTDDLSLGRGQKLLVADESDWPLLEVRELVIAPLGS